MQQLPKITTYGAEPHPEFLRHIRQWVALHNNKKATALIFATKRCCLLLGPQDSPHPWVVFWNPLSQYSGSHAYELVPTQWYDLEYLPNFQRKPLQKAYAQFEHLLDESKIRDITPFRKGG